MQKVSEQRTTQAKCLFKHLVALGRLLATSFKDAPREVRQKVHSFPGKHLDWRWEHLEEVLEQFIDIYPTFVSHFNSLDFQDESSLCKKVKSGCECPWFGLFSECLYVICYQIGKEARWLEGCYCHEDKLIACSNWRKRVRSMQEVGARERTHISFGAPHSQIRNLCRKSCNDT